MTIEQIYTGCLAQGAYYIESEGEAVVIDPLREVQPYLDRAAKSGAKIKYILETHFQNAVEILGVQNILNGLLIRRTFQLLYSLFKIFSALLIFFLQIP